MAQDDVFQVSVLQVCNGIKIVNVFHAKQTDDNTDPPRTEITLAKAFIDVVLAKWILLTSVHWKAQWIAVKQIAPTIGATFSYPCGEDGYGTVDELAIPTNSVAVVDLYSDELTRKGRGKTHLSGLTRDEANDGSITSACLALIRAFDETLGDDITPTGGGHTYRPGIWSTTHLEFYPITGAVVRANLRTLRSRTR